MRILFLHAENAGTSYIRMIQYAKYLRRFPNTEVAYSNWDKNNQLSAGWQFKVKDPAVIRDFTMLFKKADIAVCQTVTTGGAVALIAALQDTFKKPILMEIDDYHFGVPSYNPAFGTYHPGAASEKWALYQIGLSDGLIVATDWLKKALTKYHPKIDVIRNGIDFENWGNLKKPKEHKGIRVGWCGGGSHNEDLIMIAPVIYEILDKYKDVHFEITGGDVPKLKKHKRLKVYQSWTDSLKYPQHLRDLDFDIGVAPLMDNAFNRGKSALRWMEYSALFIPTIASNIEPFQKAIIDGETGFLANSEDDWFRKISYLIEDTKLRKNMGLNAYWEIEKHYNLKDISEEYLKLLKTYR